MSDIGNLLCVVLFWSGISAKGLDLKGLVQLALALEDRYGLCFIEMVALNLKFEPYFCRSSWVMKPRIAWRQLTRFTTSPRSLESTWLFQLACRDFQHDLCLPRTQELDREQADDVIRTWYVSFLLAGNFSASSPEEVHAKKDIFARTGEHQKNGVLLCNSATLWFETVLGCLECLSLTAWIPTEYLFTICRRLITSVRGFGKKGQQQSQVSSVFLYREFWSQHFSLQRGT